jgi:hypothetical protein
MIPILIMNFLPKGECGAGCKRKLAVVAAATTKRQLSAINCRVLASDPSDGTIN